MSRVIKLFEQVFPGQIVGKEVINRDSMLIGLCTGVLLDLDDKTIYLLVSGQNFMYKFSLDDILEITDTMIRVDTDIGIESVSADIINQKKALLRYETKIISQLLYSQAKKDFSGSSGNKMHIAKLFHLT